MPDRATPGHGLSQPSELQRARGERDRGDGRGGVRRAGGGRAGEGHAGPPADDRRRTGRIIRMDEIIGELLLLTSHKLRTESRERVQKYEIVIMLQGDASPQFLYCFDISPNGPCLGSSWLQTCQTSGGNSQIQCMQHNMGIEGTCHPVVCQTQTRQGGPESTLGVVSLLFVFLMNPLCLSNTCVPLYNTFA